MSVSTMLPRAAGGHGHGGHHPFSHPFGGLDYSHDRRSGGGGGGYHGIPSVPSPERSADEEDPFYAYAFWEGPPLAIVIDVLQGAPAALPSDSMAAAPAKACAAAAAAAPAATSRALQIDIPEQGEGETSSGSDSEADSEASAPAATTATAAAAASSLSLARSRSDPGVLRSGSPPGNAAAAATVPAAAAAPVASPLPAASLDAGTAAAVFDRSRTVPPAASAILELGSAVPAGHVEIAVTCGGLGGSPAVSSAAAAMDAAAAAAAAAPGFQRHLSWPLYYDAGGAAAAAAATELCAGRPQPKRSPGPRPPKPPKPPSSPLPSGSLWAGKDERRALRRSSREDHLKAAMERRPRPSGAAQRDMTALLGLILTLCLVALLYFQGATIAPTR